MPQHGHSRLELSDLALQFKDFLTSLSSSILGFKLKYQFIQLLNPAFQRKVFFLVPLALHLYCSHFSLVPASHLLDLDFEARVSSMGELVSQLLDFSDVSGRLLLDVRVLATVLFELFEYLFVFGLQLFFGVFLQVLKLLALLLQELFQLDYGIAVLLPLLVRRIPLLGQLLYHLFIHVPVQGFSLNFPVLVHVLLQVCVESFDFSCLEEADNLKVFSHEDFFLAG